MKLTGTFIAVILCLTGGSLRAADADSKIFGLTKRHHFQLTVTAANYTAMEPPPTTPFGGGPRPAGGPGRPAPSSPDFGAGNFGYEFAYVQGDVEVDGSLYKNIGVRYKGSGTYAMSTRQTKRSLKIDFDRFDEAQAFHDEKKVNLNSGVMDVTKAREVLAYAVFHAAGVPAPRTALAEVSLTVPGKFDREYLGLYTLVEQVDKSFLKAHFQSSKGLLLKPEGIRGLPYFGEDGAVYDASYQSKNTASPEQWERLVALTRLINRADEETFRREIANYLDTGMFAKFLAANTMLASLDGFIGMGHNYYLYLNPESNKFVFFPWDLDLAFGAFPMYGSPQQLLDLSIDHPHVGENKLIDRLLAMPEFKQAYRQELQTLATELFTPEKLGSQIRLVEETLQPLLEKDKAAAAARKEGGGAMGPGGLFGATPVPLATFMEKRAASVRAQLAGETKGYVPTPGIGFGGPPGGFGPGQQLAKPLLDALDANKDGQVSTAEFNAGMQKFAREWDQDKSDSLNQKELADGLQKLLPAPMFRPAGPGRP
ncbi:MAG TPA: CotH kinase family protein [Pirellulaceae bacterium]|nr:CotH kinase family protein [Pirellulaceae bacterium]